MTNPESTTSPHTREVLETFLSGESVGSPRWLRVGDYFAELRAEARLNILKVHPAFGPRALETQQAIAEWAKITETIRNRKIGPDAAAYLDEGAQPQPVYAGYYNACTVRDPQDEDTILSDQTNERIGDTVLADMEAIAAGRPAVS